MSDSQKKWDDVPSLELEIDWDFEPENPMGRRAYARLSSKQLHYLFQKQDIPVRIATNKRQFRGILLDVSQGGALVQTDIKRLEVSQLIKVAFFLGEEKILSKGRIRNIRKEDGNTLLGIEFVGLAENTNNFITTLYSAVKIRN